MRFYWPDIKSSESKPNSIYHQLKEQICMLPKQEITCLSVKFLKLEFLWEQRLKNMEWMHIIQSGCQL
jgi:hypothetical protein